MIDPIAVFVLLLGAATPILFAALGELVVERAGVLNLGVEGMMIGGALAGFAAAHATGSPAIGFAVAAVAGVLLSMIFALLTQYLLSNQVATGLALTLFGLGLTAMFGKPYEGVKAPAMMTGPLGLNLMIWLGLIMVPLVWWGLTRTRPGLILRAVGENHDAAHALGYPVRRVRPGDVVIARFRSRPDLLVVKRAVRPYRDVEARSLTRLRAAVRPESAAIGIPGPGCALPPAT